MFKLSMSSPLPVMRDETNLITDAGLECATIEQLYLKRSQTKSGKQLGRSISYLLAQALNEGENG